MCGYIDQYILSPSRHLVMQDSEWECERLVNEARHSSDMGEGRREEEREGESYKHIPA